MDLICHILSCLHMAHLRHGSSLAFSSKPNEDHATTLCLNVPTAWQKMSDLLLGLQVGMGALLAATIAVTSPMAYAAPFDTDTGLAPLGTLNSQSGSTLHQITCLPFGHLQWVPTFDRDVCQKQALALWQCVLVLDCIPLSQLLWLEMVMCI